MANESYSIHGEGTIDILSIGGVTWGNGWLVGWNFSPKQRNRPEGVRSTHYGVSSRGFDGQRTLQHPSGGSFGHS